MLNELDISLFKLINGINTGFLDMVMYGITGKWTWIPFYLFLLLLVIKQFGKISWQVLVAIALMILVSDQLSVAVKNNVQRYRPCHEPELKAEVHLVNGKCGGTYGFYSSHASNTASLAVFLIFLLRFRRMVPVMLLWIILVGYSRIYLGAHYPTDIATGWITGGLLGFVAFKLLTRINPAFLNRQ